MNLEHISAKLDPQSDLDDIVRELAKEVFSNFQQRELIIINIIASHGPLNQTKLAEISELQSDIDRFAVRRCIRRTDGLLDRGYLVERPTYRARYGKQEFMFTLPMKGIIAACSSRLRLEQIYSVKSYVEFFRKVTNDAFCVADLLLFYWKYHIAGVLAWFRMIGMELSVESDFTRLLSGRLANNLIEMDLPISDISESKYKRFWTLTEHFIVLRRVLSLIIRRLARETSIIKSMGDLRLPSLNPARGPGQRKSPLEEGLNEWLLENWATYIEINGAVPFGKDPFLIQTGPGSGRRFAYFDEEPIKKKVKEMLGLIGLR